MKSLWRLQVPETWQPLVERYHVFIPVIIAIAANLLIWSISLCLLASHTKLLAPAVLAYTYGLRHALDADHISAIDNLTRRLLADGQRPVSVGLWFSLGHSTVVIMTCVVIAATSAALASKFDNYKAIGGIIGTSVSMSFLLLIGIANCFVLCRLLASLRTALHRRRRLKGQQSGGSTTSREGQHDVETTETIKTNGVLYRLFSSLFRMIDAPWKMYPLGILFGLGFDTSTEIALLGIASLQGSTGTPIFLILIFPALFTAGMMLVDTIDGAGMYLAYTSRVFVGNKIARLYYAVILTAMSIVVALTIGIIQLLSLIANTAAPEGAFWDGVERAGNAYDVIGGCIVAAFVLIVAFSALLHWGMNKRAERQGRGNQCNETLDGQVYEIDACAAYADLNINSKTDAQDKQDVIVTVDRASRTQ